MLVVSETFGSFDRARVILITLKEIQNNAAECYTSVGLPGDYNW